MTIRILIIEDDVPWADALKLIYARACRKALNLRGVTFDTADCFDAARKALLGREKYDLVSLDLTLSEPTGVSRSGLSLLPLFRGRDPAIPGLIIVTGAARGVRRRLQAGVREALHGTSVRWEPCEN